MTIIFYNFESLSRFNWCMEIFKRIFICSERVTAGRALDLPVYFGDAGSKEVGP